MSAAEAECREKTAAIEDFDVIAACQRWLELDFPDRPDTAPAPAGPQTTTGGAR